MTRQDKFFSAVYQHSPIGLVIVDSTTALVKVNKYMFSCFDLKPTKYQGKKFGNVFHCSAVSEGLQCGETEKCYSCELRNGVIHVLQDKAVLESITINQNFDINGIQTLKWFKISASPVTVKEQKFAIVSFADITQEKNLQFELEHKNIEIKKTQELMQLIFDSTNDGIGMLDKHGVILNLNESLIKRFGQTKQKLVGLNMADILPKENYGDLFEKRMEIVKSVIATGAPSIFEDSRDGYTYENRFYPVYKDSEVSAVTLFSTDISDRKKAEKEERSKAELEIKLKVVTEFFSNISHEFKTPLTIILLQFELMELYLKDEQKIQKLLAIARQNSYRMVRLVGNLLDIAKIDAGYMKANLENVNLACLIKDICESAEAFANAKSVHLHLKNDMHSEMMPTDIGKLERILFNLLSNAIKHTHKQGAITVTIQNRKDGGAKIIVEDNGKGIPKDKQQIIFDRFAQVDPSFSRQNEGTGIGLAIVKSLVDMLNGTIQVKSELNKGSQFIIELPLLPIETNEKAIGVGGYDLSKKADIEFSDLYFDK